MSHHHHDHSRERVQDFMIGAAVGSAATRTRQSNNSFGGDYDGLAPIVGTFGVFLFFIHPIIGTSILLLAGVIYLAIKGLEAIGGAKGVYTILAIGFVLFFIFQQSDPQPKISQPDKISIGSITNSDISSGNTETQDSSTSLYSANTIDEKIANPASSASPALSIALTTSAPNENRLAVGNTLSAAQSRSTTSPVKEAKETQAEPLFRAIKDNAHSKTYPMILDAPLKPIKRTHTSPDISNIKIEQGLDKSTEFKITVGPKGSAMKCEIVISSGEAVLDNIGCNHILDNWRWVPPTFLKEQVSTTTGVRFVWKK